MALNKAYSQYEQNSVFTASPEELTFMLYNGLVKFIMQAQKSISENNVQKANDCIIKAENIIREFEITLDKKYEISKYLLAIYDYMYRRLVEANTKKDIQILEEVLGFARELRDTWSQAMKNARRQSNKSQKM